jgi:hypothetical protein
VPHYIYLFFVTFFFITPLTSAQRDPLAVIINSSLEEKINEEIRSVFTDLFLQNGFGVVERKNLDLLFSEYEDQKREDYFDGETIKVKLEGVKYYCFIDVIESNEKLSVFLFFTDVFQERILFSQSMSFEKHTSLDKQFNKYRDGIVNILDNEIPLGYYYFSGGDGIVKLLVEWSEIKSGTKLYGTIDSKIVCQFEVIRNLSSNMIECKLIDFNKKEYGKSKEFDFSTLHYQSEITETEKEKQILKIENSCIDKIAYYELIVKLNAHLLIVDNIHSQRLKFEQVLQANELFMDGKSYYAIREGTDGDHEVVLSEKDNYCEYSISINNKVLDSGKYSSSSSVASAYFSLIKN